MTQHDIVTSEGFTEEFFAPAATDLLDGLIAQYRSVRKTIAHTAGLFAGDMGNVVHYFMRGNGCDQRGYSSLIAERLFQEKGAVAALNAAYWSKALALTDVLDMMPQKRRDEWNEQITKMTTPEFTEDAVRPTLADLLASRAVKTAEGWFQFDYQPDHVINEIVASGCVPDARAHQFFPTPESVALDAIAVADIGPTDLCLEPSAGLGGMADHMPRGRTVCVEVSPLHCKVLIAKGHQVFEADFLAWRGGLYDRIVMNPPFSDGRWQAHLAHAATLLAPGGRLVAVLPASANGKDVLPGRSPATRPQAALRGPTA